MDASTLTRDGLRIVDRNTGDILVSGMPGRNDPRGPQDLGIFTGRRPMAGALSPTHHQREPYWCPHAANDLWTCKSCNYGIARADGRPVPVAAPARIREEDVVWHYKGNIIWGGLDTEGHDVHKDVRTGKIERVYSLTQKREALALADEYGLSAAGRKTGIARSTLNNWRARGVDS